MAATYTLVIAAGVGITYTALTVEGGSVSSPDSNKVWNIPRLYLGNVTASTIKSYARITTGVTTSIVNPGKAIATEDGLVLENITLRNGWRVEVKSDVTASLDAYGSVMEEDA